MFERGGLSLLLLLLALGFGAGFWLALRLRKRAAQPRQLPRRWPMAPRAVFNGRELPVWNWLRQTFGAEYAVLVKMPVTRFTMPRSANDGRDWHELLNAVYCTFTVCDAQGTVVGCVDVPAQHGVSRTNLRVKQSLLTQCGVPYWVVDPHALPAPQAIRAEFLGEQPAPVPTDADADAADPLDQARNQLHELLNRRRTAREGTPSDGAPLAPETGPWLHASDMQRTDSFLLPLDDTEETAPPRLDSTRGDGAPLRRTPA